MKQIITLSFAFLVLSCQGVKIDPSPMSGTINEGDEKTSIVKKLTFSLPSRTLKYRCWKIEE